MNCIKNESDQRESKSRRFPKHCLEMIDTASINRTKIDSKILMMIIHTHSNLNTFWLYAIVWAHGEQAYTTHEWRFSFLLCIFSGFFCLLSHSFIFTISTENERKNKIRQVKNLINIFVCLLAYVERSEMEFYFFIFDLATTKQRFNARNNKTRS